MKTPALSTWPVSFFIKALHNAVIPPLNSKL